MVSHFIYEQLMLIAFANLLMFVESVSDRSGQCMALNSKTGALLATSKTQGL